jgi:hypothetical protein
MSDRFDLEQAILGCWHIVDDLELIKHDELAAALAKVYQAKFEKCFDLFEECVRNGKM